MASAFSKILATSVILIAVIYQLFLKTLIFDVLGYGRTLSPLSGFNVRCERLDNVGLEACEEMWLHEPSGHLYMACGSSLGRTKWFPATDGHLNPAGRQSSDRVAILDTRGIGPAKDRLRWMTTPDFTGSHGDGALDLHGIDARASSGDSSKLKILLNNHRPPRDPETGAFLDATKLGANSTIEVFETVVGDSTMQHVKTYAYPIIEVPNSVAWLSDDSFLFTNDRSGKVGFRRSLDVPLRNSGSVGYCDLSGCRLIVPSGFAYANGIIKGQDGLIYVANSLSGDIYVYEFEASNATLKRVDTITIPQPIDNVSQDSNGDIYTASFPVAHKFFKSNDDPFGIFPPTAAWRIRKEQSGDYAVEKVLEDDGSVLPGATGVVHDPKTGRMFLGGASAPFIGICEPL